MSKIKVLLVEDSAIAINIYEKMLNSFRQIEVIGTSNGKGRFDLAFSIY